MDIEPIPMLDMSSAKAKRAAYELLQSQARSLFEGERDWLANLSQFSALVFNSVPDLNWAGFYVARDDRTLVLGPFQGKVACVRIPFDKGVCGACARTLEVQLVEDVHSFPGHIACDSASRSELVLPVVVGGRLRAVFDMDSPTLARFDSEDAHGMTAALHALVAATNWE